MKKLLWFIPFIFLGFAHASVTINGNCYNILWNPWTGTNQYVTCPGGGSTTATDTFHVPYGIAGTTANFSGNVGIATTTPVSPLSVGGNVTITGSVIASTFTASSAVVISSSSYIQISTNVGGGYMGTGTLSSGSATITTNKCHAGDFIFVTDTGSSITNLGSLQVQSVTAGSFQVKSTNILDTSTFNWLIVRPGQ